MKHQRKILYPDKSIRTLFIAGVTSLLFEGAGSFPHPSPTASPHCDKTETVLHNISMQDAFREGKVRSICEYLGKLPKNAEHIDTVVINKHNYKTRICLGKYVETKDSVYLHYFIPDTSNVSPELKQEIMDFVNYYNSPSIYGGDRAHEWKHFDTMHALREKVSKQKLPKKIAFRADVSPEEIIKFNQHNEIASRIATVLYQRELYKQSGDLSVFSSFASEYKQAIENGIFNPLFMSPEQSELENRYIASVISKWWIKHEQHKNPYVNRQKLEIWFKKGKKKRFDDNPELYTKMLNLTYTFIKDGHLINMNYFFNADYYAKELSIQNSADISNQATKPFLLALPKSFIFKNPPIIGDVTPQQSVLAITPKLRKMEAFRLAKADYQKRQQNKFMSQQKISQSR